MKRSLHFEAGSARRESTTGMRGGAVSPRMEHAKPKLEHVLHAKPNRSAQTWTHTNQSLA
jgi:hypothetical protein